MDIYDCMKITNLNFFLKKCLILLIVVFVLPVNVISQPLSSPSSNLDVSVTIISCGDGTCNGNEDCNSCANDCGSCVDNGPVPSNGGGSGGGGGGASGSKLEEDFIINKNRLKVSLKSGEIINEGIIIENTGDKKIEIKVDNRFQKFLRLEETDFSLEKRESKTLSLVLRSEENSVPDLYLGKIIVKGEKIVKEVLIFLEIESNKPLFDVLLDLPESSLEVFPGEEIIGNIVIFNLVETGEVDINVNYVIKDLNDKKIVEESEILGIDRELRFEKALKIPEDENPGDYLYYISVTYDNEVGNASDTFFVNEIPINKLWYLLSLLILLLFIFLIFNDDRKFKKKSKMKRKSKK